MNGNAIVNRRVCCYNDLVSCDGIAAGCDNLAFVNRISMSAGKNLAAILLDRFRQAVQILERMKLPLTRKMQAGSSVKTINRRSVHTSDFREAGTMRRW